MGVEPIRRVYHHGILSPARLPIPSRRLIHKNRWCGRPDLNRYGFIHTPLKRARLPIPPRPLITSHSYLTMVPYSGRNASPDFRQAHPVESEGRENRLRRSFPGLLFLSRRDPLFPRPQISISIGVIKAGSYLACEACDREQSVLFIAKTIVGHFFV